MTKEILPIEFTNVLRLHNGDDDEKFLIVNEDEVTLKNAVVISMIWKPEGLREKVIWKLFKDLLMKNHHEAFEKAEKEYETVS